MEPYLIGALTLTVTGLAALAFTRPRIYQKMFMPFMAVGLAAYLFIGVWSIAVTRVSTKLMPLLVAAKIDDKALLITENLAPDVGTTSLCYLVFSAYLMFLSWLADHVIADDRR